MTNKFFILIFGLLVAKVAALAQPNIAIDVSPKTVYIERSETQQYLNFDFLIHNVSQEKQSLNKVTVSVFDAQNKLIYSRFLDNNGTAPSIQTLPERDFESLSSQLIFNPFPDFDGHLTIAKMRFDWEFSNAKDENTLVTTEVFPQVYVQKEAFDFPLKGNVLVYDAHDFYAHHRRFNYEFAPIKQLGITSNFMRYAYDFVLLNQENQKAKGDENISENFIGYGKLVYAVGDGQVIYASNVHKDDKTFEVPKLATNPLELYGNCIAIKHKNGTVSIYGHLKENSLQVKIGDAVTKGQSIAAIGVSGSSFFPHLHFEMRTSIQNGAEGLPSYFSNVSSNGVKLSSGFVATGSVLQTK